MKIVQLIHLILIQVYIIQMFVGKQEHVDQRHTVAVQIVDDVAVLLIVHRIGRIDNPRLFDIHIRQLGELPGRQGIRQHIGI